MIVMPIRCISGVNNNKIFTINKNKPITTSINANMATKNIVLNIFSAVFGCI